MNVRIVRWSAITAFVLFAVTSLALGNLFSSDLDLRNGYQPIHHEHGHEDDCEGFLDPWMHDGQLHGEHQERMHGEEDSDTVWIGCH